MSKTLSQYPVTKINFNSLKVKESRQQKPEKRLSLVAKYGAVNLGYLLH